MIYLPIIKIVELHVCKLLKIYLVANAKPANFDLINTSNRLPTASPFLTKTA